MHIRQIANDDLPALLLLYRYLHEEEHTPADDRSAALVWDEINRNPRYRYIGAYVDAQLVATCTIAVIPNLTRGCRPYGLIENVVTHGEHRGKGYGKAVVKNAMEHAWEQDCYKVMLLTGRLDEKIFRFYESVGFDRHGKQAFVARADGM